MSVYSVEAINVGTLSMQNLERIQGAFFCICTLATAVLSGLSSRVARIQSVTASGDRVGVSACTYNDSNSLGDRANEGRGSERRHAGTGEGISARIHVANSHGDRAEEGRRSNRRHSTNSLLERVDSCLMLVIGNVVGMSRSRGVESSIIGCQANQVKSADC